MSTYNTERTEPTRPEPTRASTTTPTANMSSQSIDWAQCKPKVVSQEDSMTKALNEETWKKLYVAAKVTDEQSQRLLRAGVYVYCAINGTSRVGSYQGEIQLANGTVVSAAEIPRAAGNNIRKFLRANMDESYRFFKESRAMEDHPRFVSRASELGVSAQEAFAIADWLTDCPLFTPAEKKAHSLSFNFAIQRAKRARDGKSLERVEGENLGSTLRAQGQAEAPEADVSW